STKRHRQARPAEQVSGGTRHVQYAVYVQLGDTVWVVAGHHNVMPLAVIDRNVAGQGGGAHPVIASEFDRPSNLPSCGTVVDNDAHRLNRIERVERLTPGEP